MAKINTNITGKKLRSINEVTEGMTLVKIERQKYYI